MSVDGILENLRREKALMSGELDGEDAFDLSPVNDVEGQCATTLALHFDSPIIVRSFIKKLEERGIGASTPIDSGRHVYQNWDPIMRLRQQSVVMVEAAL